MKIKFRFGSVTPPAFKKTMTVDLKSRSQESMRQIISGQTGPGWSLKLDYIWWRVENGLWRNAYDESRITADILAAMILEDQARTDPPQVQRCVQTWGRAPKMRCSKPQTHAGECVGSAVTSTQPVWFEPRQGQWPSRFILLDPETFEPEAGGDLGCRLTTLSRSGYVLVLALGAYTLDPEGWSLRMGLPITHGKMAKLIQTDRRAKRSQETAAGDTMQTPIESDDLAPLIERDHQKPKNERR